ncbi:MAG: UDP-2,3-diacylglucosamine diphosphatase [Xanthomonadaceae bacterium]|nr:UDP-2,3-diacylglucosamine diphosphatase [Xanthomonadaceae bacterium]MDP2183976.1 UDP-2,3-diacylglucosamine diphosphatase [Xanthomonadales bacterium]MDZ4116543.1 UDP-2,3-diacylglucosamine diphosphatase [Xanthomonadaceae bacterium]MDZ4376763.1 UDP-2,3-diacylglucosamine diphosphatase [Xanthomonadaceae bacterium]
MSAHTLFISDLHLDASRPQATAAFIDFLADEAVRADALYILGDLFEAWLGDDDDAPLADTVAMALHTLEQRGVAVYFQRGNRDFLLGTNYARRCGMRLLPDPSVIDLYAAPTLLSHGDLLCSDDITYQQFRQQVRSPEWQSEFLAQPLSERAAFAVRARAASHAHQQGIDETISDVTADTVNQWFERFGIQRMIHGHTHRPAIHVPAADPGTWQRIVLGDWYHQGSVLRIAADGETTLRCLPFA